MENNLKELKAIYEALRDAPRLGAEKDDPEGSRYIVISDTLALQMQASLRKAIADDR